MADNDSSSVMEELPGNSAVTRPYTSLFIQKMQMHIMYISFFQLQVHDLLGLVSSELQWSVVLTTTILWQEDGNETHPITIKGNGGNSNRERVVVKGSGKHSRVFQIRHDYYIIEVRSWGMLYTPPALLSVTSEVFFYCTRASFTSMQNGVQRRGLERCHKMWDLPERVERSRTLLVRHFFLRIQ